MADMVVPLGKLVVVALLSAWWATPSQAQSTGAGSPPACVTNTGPTGQAFAGFLGTVASPVPYADVEVIGEGLTAYPDIRFGLHALIVADEAAANLAAIELRFSTPDGAAVHACAVTLVGFDPSIHDPGTIAFGTCDFDLIEGPPVLLAGQSQRYELPEELVEVATAPVAVLDASPQTDRIVRIVGVALGIGTFTWLRDRDGDDQDGDNLMGVCPFTVGDASGK